jgi:hypothetical protein
MKISTRRAFMQSLCVGGLTYASSSALSARQPMPETHTRNRFTVFNGLLFRPMPDLRALGMPMLQGIGNTWRPGISHQELDPIGMADGIRYARRFSDDCYFDLEEWTVYGNPPDVEERIHKHLQAIEIARQTAPTMRFGFYGVVPTAPYWSIILDKKDELAAWRALNERSQVIARKVDYLFPSLYTFYDDPKGWELQAREVLKEAKKLGTPVYPFLWREFHDSNKKLGGTEIPREFWRRELEVCRECADGVVLWGGFAQRWDEEAAWWVETRSFLASLGNQSAAQPQS